MPRSSDSPGRVAATAFCVATLLAGCDDGGGNGAPPEPGQTRFVNYCSACHQLDGTGSEEGIPPLVDSPWVKGPEGRLIRIVLHGLRGAIVVGDTTYDLEMQGFGMLFSDADVASVLTFVRRSFGGVNEPVTPEAVSRVRAETENRIDYWTADELLQVQ